MSIFCGCFQRYNQLSYEKHSEIAASSWQKIIKIGYNETQRSYQQIYLADADFLHAVEE